MARYVTNFESSKLINNRSSGSSATNTAHTLSVFKAFHVSGNLILPINETDVLEDYTVHSRIMKKSGLSHFAISPISYLKLGRPESFIPSRNSSLNSIASSSEYYENIEKQLVNLSEADDEDDVIEEGAIRTARAVLGQLQLAQFAPPALTWHGGDAVVMLWSLGGTTYAITVTDGEVGYVVRRDRKEIRSKDSISINAFKLQDLN